VVRSSASTSDEVLGGKVRGQIVRLLEQFGTLTLRELAHALDDMPTERLLEHLELLKGYGWIIPVDGYRLTAIGRASSTRGV
jgi:DNA-binding HxlR family transcriptional regulator